jgi:lariat debranching enzyme
VWEYGDKGSLLRRKPYFAEDMASGKLGSPPLRQLLQLLRPSFWFAAHLHVKFAAVVPHSSAIGDDGRSSTVTGRGSGGSGSNGDTPDERLQQQQKQYQQQQAYCAPVGGISTRFLALDKVFPGRYVKLTERIRQVSHY